MAPADSQARQLDEQAADTCPAPQTKAADARSWAARRVRRHLRQSRRAVAIRRPPAVLASAWAHTLGNPWATCARGVRRLLGVLLQVPPKIAVFSLAVASLHVAGGARESAMGGRNSFAGGVTPLRNSYATSFPCDSGPRNSSNSFAPRFLHAMQTNCPCSRTASGHEAVTPVSPIGFIGESSAQRCCGRCCEAVSPRPKVLRRVFNRRQNTDQLGNYRSAGSPVS